MKFEFKMPDLSKLGSNPSYTKARDFLVTHRNAVLSTSLALLIGLWSGSVLGNAGGGGPVSATPFFLGGGQQAARSASAPRAGVPAVQGMAFVRLRTQMDGANPRACLEFSKPLSTDPSIHYRDYLTLDPDAQVQTDISGNLLCLSGLSFDPDHQVTIKTGLPAQNGERTTYDEHFTLTFGDRPAYVGFAGNGVILPRSEADGLAIESVNVSKIGIEVLRVPDRILSQHELSPGETFEEGGWGGDYVDGQDVGVSVYKGTVDVAGAKDHRNSAVTTVFALGAALADLRAGAYIVKLKDETPGAGSTGENTDNPATAYRWIIYTDIALQTFSGGSGIDIVARSLRNARPLSNTTVTLIAQNNDELARARTDGQGHVHFAQSLVNGEGPAHARYVMAYGSGGDFTALDLNRSSLDLSDRGVDGRRSPGDVDAYVFTERGVYRPGETVRVTALIRDTVGRAIANRPSTLVVYRPNGTEARRIRMSEAVAAGAIAKNIDIDRGAPRGQWRADLLVDGQDAVAGNVSWSVEDFVPQRLKVQVNAAQGVLHANETRPMSVQADFLYGAPGAGLPVEAEGRLMVDPNPFPDQSGYSFGKADESFDERILNLPGATTDGSGHADLMLSLTDQPQTSLPLRARIVASVADPGGRMVKESFTVPVRLSSLYLGLKARFDNDRAASGQAITYDLIALNADGRRAAVRGVQWQLVREDWSYDWYLDNGTWRWRRTGRDIPIDGATVDVGAGAPTTISKDGLRDGSYRLVVTANGAETSTRFGVGWGGPAEDESTPDMVTVAGPTDKVHAGGRAHIQIHPPYAGEAEIVVATDRVIETRTIHVDAGGANVDLPVSDQWGSGAYVLVTVMTPRDPVNLPVPRRAIGVAYVPVDMGARTMQVTVGQGVQMRPRTRVNLPIDVRNAPMGEHVRVVVALVDEGILNLTKYESPNPVDYFFGRHGLGVDVRDDYGRLLNPNLGAPAAAHQGGDQLGGEGLTVVPTKTVALFSSVTEVQGGHAVIPVDVPDFNGTLRVMAVAWSESALGQASQQVIVRDPVVAELILPRFLSPSDEADATLNVDNVEGPAGAYSVTITGSPVAGVTSPAQRFNLPRGQRQTAAIPIMGGAPGIGHVHIALQGPSGFTPIEHDYDIQSRAPFLPITLVDVQQQAAGASWRAPGDALSQFQPSNSQALISYSNLANLDPAQLIDALYRYPYGCSEQLVSVAMPLLYYNTLASEAGRNVNSAITRRVQDTAQELLDRMGTDGAFGLWHAGDGQASPWLGAYVADFLTRARAQGVAVPQAAITQAYGALRSVARLNDNSSVGYQFDVYHWPGNNDSEALLRSRAAAYAIYVLAKAGQADIGQVRYFHDTKLAAEPSPLARAQIGAALAYMGDRARAHHAFQMAEQALGYRNTGDWYQTPLRDEAGVLALAAEANESDLVGRLRQRLERDAPNPNQMMTQEQVQLLLAANALLQRSGPVNVSLNGHPMDGRRLFANTQQLAAGLVFRNDGRGPVWRTLSTTGAPLQSPPAMANGFSIDKRVFRMDGTVADLASVRQGDRVVVVLSGSPDGARVYPTVVVDLLPAGLEIETTLGPPDGAGADQPDGTKHDGPFGWIGSITNADVSEARDDRYVASRNLRGEGYRFAYIARAVTPGRYTMPAAQVEDMYRPGVMARSATGSIRIAPRGG
ncbi:MAG: alpha-2-macroglobulin [Alphaproteobacteria bacterium]